MTLLRSFSLFGGFGSWLFMLVGLASLEVLAADPKEARNSATVHRPTSEQLSARARIHRHLTKLAGKPVPRQSAADLQAVDNWVQVRDYEGASSNVPALCALFARDLSLAARLLDSPDLPLRQSGLRLAKTVLMYAHLQCGDPQLVAAMCDTYLMPYIAVAESDPTAFASRGSVLETAYVVYKAAKETRKMEQTLRLSLAGDQDSNSADTHHLLLAQVLRQQQRYRAAISELKKMQTRNFKNAAAELTTECEQEQARSRKRK